MINDTQTKLTKMVQAANDSVKAVEKSNKIQLQMLNELKEVMTEDQKKELQFVIEKMSSKIETGNIDALNELMKEWELK